MARARMLWEDVEDELRELMQVRNCGCSNMFCTTMAAIAADLLYFRMKSV